MSTPRKRDKNHGHLGVEVKVRAASKRERDDWKRKAKIAGMTLNQWIRAVANGHPMPF